MACSNKQNLIGWQWSNETEQILSLLVEGWVFFPYMMEYRKMGSSPELSSQQ